MGYIGTPNTVDQPLIEQKDYTSLNAKYTYKNKRTILSHTYCFCKHPFVFELLMWPAIDTTVLNDKNSVQGSVTSMFAKESWSLPQGSSGRSRVIVYN